MWQGNNMQDRSKWVAIVTGAMAVALGIGYLLLVQILDWRGELLPISGGDF